MVESDFIIIGTGAGGLSAALHASEHGSVIMLTKRDDLTTEEFRRWWLEEHRPLALGLPGLRRMLLRDQVHAVHRV